MILATGDLAAVAHHGVTAGLNHRRRQRAFTVLEVLLAIALLGLVAALFVTSGSDLFRAHERTATDVFWQAVQAARLQAVQQDKSVPLRFDEKERRVIWGSGDTTSSLAWPGKALEFLPVERQGAILLGGQLTDTGRIEVVRFHADGGVDAFRAQLTELTGQVIRLELDPWTAAPVVRSKP